MVEVGASRYYGLDGRASAGVNVVWVKAKQLIAS